MSCIAAFTRSAAIASLAIFLTAAQADGADADKAAAAVERGLVFLASKQGDDDSWPGQVSAEFGTGEACLILRTARRGK